MKIADLDNVAAVIKPIAEQIELLASRINANRSSFDGNETATRLQLIDPMLRELGWDTADPNQVRHEYSVGSRNADYVLLARNRPIAIVEAKNLKIKIDSESRLQALSYVDSASIRYVIVTNGDRWELYNSSLSETKPLGVFTVSRDASPFAALEAAKISRDIMIATIDQREIAPSSASGGTTQRQNADSYGQSNERIERGPDPTVAHSDGSWVDLIDPDFDPRGKRPLELRISGKEIRAPVSKSSKQLRWDWTKILIAVATWLIKNDRLDINKCPIKKFPTGDQYLIHTNKVHADGDDFRAPKDLPRSMFMDTHGGADQVVGFCRDLLEKFNGPDASVRVESKTEPNSGNLA